MRDLTRLALFVVARLGLFLAVVAWVVVSLTVGPQSIYGLRTSGLCVDLSTDGWDVAIIEVSEPYYVGRIKTSDPMPSPGLGPPISILMNRGNALWMFFIRHWLIVTMFVVFNLCLHWFYRRRPEAEPHQGQSGSHFSSSHDWDTSSL